HPIVPDPDQVPITQRDRLGDANAIHQGPVGAPEVLQENRPVPLHQASMAARDVPLGEVDEIVLPPADGDLVAAEGDLPAPPLVVLDPLLHGSTRPLPSHGPMLQGAAT